MHASPSQRRPHWAARVTVNVLVAGAAFAAGHFTGAAMHAGSTARPPVTGRHAEAPAHAAQRPLWDGRAAYPANGPRPGCAPAIAGRVASLGTDAVRCTRGRDGAFTWSRVTTLAAWHAAHTAHLAHLHTVHLHHLKHVMRSIE